MGVFVLALALAVLGTAGIAAAGSGSWMSVPSPPVAFVNDHAASLLNDGKLLVTGGKGNSGSNSAAALFDPASGSWTVGGAMAAGREAATATALPDGKVLVAGGVQTGPTGINYLASAEIYDPVSGKWSATGPMAKPRAAHTATLLRTGEVLVAGGVLGGHDPLVSTAELYDPSTGSWSPTGSMENGRAEHTATLLADGTVLAVGGRGNAHSASLQDLVIYDPTVGKWAPAPHQLNEIRGLHTATLFADGKVLITGGTKLFSGNRVDDVLASTEIYDPTAKTITKAAPLKQPRYYHTATMLPNGQVLVAGGYGGKNGGLAVDPLTSTELFTPGTGQWVAGNPLPTPVGPANSVGRPTATLIGQKACGNNCGKVLMTGGGVAALYSPQAGAGSSGSVTWTSKASSKVLPMAAVGVVAAIVLVGLLARSRRRKG